MNMLNDTRDVGDLCGDIMLVWLALCAFYTVLFTKWCFLGSEIARRLTNFLVRNIKVFEELLR